MQPLRLFIRRSSSQDDIAMWKPSEALNDVVMLHGKAFQVGEVMNDIVTRPVSNE